MRIWIIISLVLYAVSAVLAIEGISAIDLNKFKPNAVSFMMYLHDAYVSIVMILLSAILLLCATAIVIARLCKYE